MMHGGEGIYRLDLTAEVSREEVLPEIKLKTLVQASSFQTIGVEEVLVNCWEVSKHNFAYIGPGVLTSVLKPYYPPPSPSENYIFPLQKYA